MCAHPRSRPKLVEFARPCGPAPRVCATLWQRGREVRLHAPALHDAAAAKTALGSTLVWLDAARFGAASATEVRQDCAANLDWRLRCAPFDGSDRALRALGALIRIHCSAGARP